MTWEAWLFLTLSILLSGLVLFLWNLLKMAARDVIAARRPIVVKIARSEDAGPEPS